MNLGVLTEEELIRHIIKEVEQGWCLLFGNMPCITKFEDSYYSGDHADKFNAYMGMAFRRIAPFFTFKPYPELKKELNLLKTGPLPLVMAFLMPTTNKGCVGWSYPCDRDIPRELQAHAAITQFFDIFLFDKFEDPMHEWLKQNQWPFDAVEVYEQKENGEVVLGFKRHPDRLPDTPP